jgi:hypothetical protein
MVVVMGSISPADGVIAEVDPAIPLLCRDLSANGMDARVPPAHDALEKALEPALTGQVRA